MIPRTITAWQTKSWQEELSDLITDPAELVQLLDLEPDVLPMARRAHQLFPLRATRTYIRRIRPGNINDPLLRQILPLSEELLKTDGFVRDPLSEADCSPLPGLIHKYHGRILIVAANQCAINCRYCFRRHFNYQTHALSRQQWQESLSYIEKNPTIEEVILSGGDPLTTSDRQLRWLIETLEKIPQVSRLRIHTRLPIVAPSRITEELLDILAESRLHAVVVVHSNHPQEIDIEVSNGFGKLRKAGLTLLNQTVLLKGVNDNQQSLIGLSKTLFASGALPYYLHLLDKVEGASHFYVDKSRALSLNNALLVNLPGYLVPKLVKEVPNAPSKIPII